MGLQEIAIAKEWESVVFSGEKTKTTRYGDRDYKLGNCLITDSQKIPLLIVNIKSVTKCRFSDMPESIALDEGFSSKSKMLDKLRDYYPDITIESVVTIVEWKR